jgi:hypothetical protein
VFPPAAVFACDFVFADAWATTREGTQRNKNAAVAAPKIFRQLALEAFSYLLPV